MVSDTGTAASNSKKEGSGAQVVLHAAVRVLVRDGLDGLSVRRVATEANFSIGAVQHHFPTKDALLVAAAKHITSEFKIRATSLTRRIMDQEGSIPAFVDFCLLLANAAPPPHGEAEDTTASIIWLWYAAKSTQAGAVADAFAAGWSQTESYLTTVISELFPRVDARQEAAHLLAVLDGLAIARATEPKRMPVKRAATIVDRHVAYLRDMNPDTNHNRP